MFRRRWFPARHSYCLAIQIKLMTPNQSVTSYDTDLISIALLFSMTELYSLPFISLSFSLPPLLFSLRLCLLSGLPVDTLNPDMTSINCHMTSINCHTTSINCQSLRAWFACPWALCWHDISISSSRGMRSYSDMAHSAHWPHRHDT